MSSQGCAAFDGPLLGPCRTASNRRARGCNRRTRSKEHSAYTHDRKIRLENQMTQAKFLPGKKKTEKTYSSFSNKIRHMERQLEASIRTGTLGTVFWPSSLAEFAAWEDAEQGIFAWKSTTVTTRNGRYSDLVERYWNLQYRAKRLFKKSGRLEEIRQLKTLNQVLAEQNAVLTWNAMELRDWSAPRFAGHVG